MVRTRLTPYVQWKTLRVPGDAYPDDNRGKFLLLCFRVPVIPGTGSSEDWDLGSEKEDEV